MNIRQTTALLAIGLSAAAVQAAEWTVDPAMSSVGFVGEQQGSKFNGRFQDFTAMVDFDTSDPSAGKISGTVVTDSVNTRDHDRDAALTDRDWFDSANFPEAQFESESIASMDDGSFEASGQLTIKGNTRPATLKFTFAEEGSGAQFNGTMMIDRFNFDVGEGWNDTSWVGQNVEVTISLKLSH